MADGAAPHFTWNLARDAGQLVEYHFMVNALLAGAIVALAAGVAGWLMVLRGEAFAGHTLSVMAFPGAAAAALAGVAGAWGYYGMCTAGALAIAGLSAGRRQASGYADAAIALVQTVALAAGFLFVSLYGGVLGDLDSQLFGTFLGVSDGRLLTLLVVALVVLAGLAAIGRPLLFATVDPVVAAARGVRVGALSAAFMVLLGLTVASTSLLTGALLTFALLVGPPASAQAITPRPLAGLVLTVAIGLAVVWSGLAAAYFSPYPAGFYVAAVSFAAYLLARGYAAWSDQRARPGSSAEPARPPAPGEVLA
jgi:zinc/manganese transport system permease protein